MLCDFDLSDAELSDNDTDEGFDTNTTAIDGIMHQPQPLTDSETSSNEEDEVR